MPDTDFTPALEEFYRNQLPHARRLAKLEDKSKLISAEYNLPSFEKFAEQMQQTVRSAVDDFIQGSIGERAWFFFSHQKFNIDHPLLASIAVPMGREDDPPIWRLDVEIEIRNFLDDRCYQSDQGRKALDDGENREAIQAMRDRLAELVAYYDDALIKPEDVK